MKRYGTGDVAELLGLSVWQVRRYARAGFLQPDRGPRGAYRFSFQDVVLLRTARELTQARVPTRRVLRALRRLRQQLPQGRPLTVLRIVAVDGEVLARDEDVTWNPADGQLQFDFPVSELVPLVAPLARQAAREARAEPAELDAEDWYELGQELEPTQPAQARDAYRRAVERDPRHAGAHAALGLLLYEAGDAQAAVGEYEAALAAVPRDAETAFNLGIALEDLNRPGAAIRAYRRAIAADPDSADAHFNLARLLEKRGDKRGAIRHLASYRRLLEQRR